MVHRRYVEASPVKLANAEEAVKGRVHETKEWKHEPEKTAAP